jgi:hypothetical protein
LNLALVFLDLAHPGLLAVAPALALALVAPHLDLFLAPHLDLFLAPAQAHPDQ